MPEQLFYCLLSYPVFLFAVLNLNVAFVSKIMPLSVLSPLFCFSQFQVTLVSFRPSHLCQLDSPNVVSQTILPFSVRPYLCLLSQVTSLVRPLIFNTVSQARIGIPSLTVQPLWDLQDVMLLHWSTGPFHPQSLPREAEDFLRGGKYFKHVSLLTHLICSQPKGIIWQVLFTCQGLLWNIISTSCWF